MHVEKVDIKAYNNQYKEQVLKVWERSVLATHKFLSQRDFHEIKDAVQSIDFTQLQVHCLTENDLVIGFIGVAEKKIEMLFLDPPYFGKGLGRLLVDFAINELAADAVDVNEENVNAVTFYRKLGFEPFERTSKDDQGRDYPLLRMKLSVETSR